MGVGKKAKAARAVVRSRAEAAAQELEKRVEGAAYRALKRGANAARSRTQRGLDAALARSAGYEQVSAAGAAVRRAAVELTALPVLSIVGDTAKAVSGVHDMSKKVKANPQDPLAAVQLAECLRRYEADMRAYRVLRSLTSPHSIPLRYGIRGGAMLGRTAMPQLQSGRAARRAAQIAARRFRERPGDCAALHALARAALLEGRLQDGLRLAQAAARGDTGPELVTLARLQLAAGRPEEAERAAAAAVHNGCSVGYEVAAEAQLQRGPDRPVREQLAEYERTLDQVRRADYLAYYGVTRTGGSFARSLLAAQGAKTWRTTVRAGRATAAALKAGAQAARRPG